MVALKRNITQMANQHYDVIVVGGGCTGAFIAYDAGLRGFKVALVEAEDFAHATSAASSKLIHGGLRYLKTMELALVRESLRERRTWQKIAPHLVRPLAFVVPTYGHGLSGKAALKAGLQLYDWLAYDRNRLEDPAQFLPGHQMMDLAQTKALGYDFNEEGLTGSGLFYDCQMWFPERLALEAILAASMAGVDLANHLKVQGFLRGQRGEVVGVKVCDQLTNDPFDIQAKIVINAAGPWADLITKDLRGAGVGTNLVRSMGIHLITREISRQHVLAFQGRGHHFFIIPWRGHSLIGTTDKIYKGDPSQYRVRTSDIEEFIQAINLGYPTANLKFDDIRHFYGGLRPMVDPGKAVESTYKTSRKAEIEDHQDQGLKGLISVIGGKWTTSRALAEKTVNHIEGILGKKGDCQTATQVLPGGGIPLLKDFENALLAKHPDLDPRLLNRLGKTYGTRVEEFLKFARSLKDGLKPLTCDDAAIQAEVLFAIRQEMALTLSDVLFRRSGLGGLGHPGEKLIEQMLAMMAAELGWDAQRIRLERDHTCMQFTPASH